MALSRAGLQVSLPTSVERLLFENRSHSISAERLHCAHCGARTALRPVGFHPLKSIAQSALKKSRSSISNRRTTRCQISSDASASRKDDPQPAFVPIASPESYLHIDRRKLLLLPVVLTGALAQSAPAAAWAPAKIDLSAAPQTQFNTSDVNFKEAADLFQQALSTGSVQQEEQLWSEIIGRVGGSKADWATDILARAYGNRGNARSRQGKREEALDDYDQSIQLAPYSVDPVLNRGVVLESLGRYSEAAADYQAVLAAEPNDPAAWNNLGNVASAQGRWQEALDNYGRAARLAPEFSFAAGNYALALYQVGRDNEALKQFRTLLRKYPEFPDIRAALAVSLYHVGLTSDAETNWSRLEDLRYKDRTWVRNTRRWPPRLVNELEAFLDVKATTGK